MWKNHFLRWTCLLLLASCQHATEPSVADWYQLTKGAIQQQANLRVDSLYQNLAPDSQRYFIEYFAQGVKIRSDFYQQGELRAQTLYSSNGQFELRREGCADRRIAFEGIVFEGEHYGLARWWHCNGMLAEQGMRFRSVKVGRWEYYDRLGQLVTTEYHGPTDSLSLMPALIP